jgi:radical SAM superfamily enzyme YgiQ (UPF0313 family)
MHYVEPIIRPPSEADSIILQVTTGCSHNKCTFCGVYKQKRFGIKPVETIEQDLSYAARHFGDTTRLFMCDGDVLIVPQPRLLAILERIHEKLPRVGRIATYANAKSIGRKTDEELSQLHRAGVKVVHMGLESGDDETLRRVNKYGDSAFIAAQGRRVREAGMKLFVTVILGLSGTERSRVHAEQTGRALSAMDPTYVGALSLMLLPNTPLHTDWEAGRFVLPEPLQMLRELRVMIEHTDVTLCLFFANHASNYLPLRARLPREKAEALRTLDAAMRGEIGLKPEWLRGL